MKATNYLHTFPLKDPKGISVSEGVLVYNAMTNALAAMEPEKYKAYENFIKSGTPIEDAELVEQLEQGGFLLPDNYDELNELRARMWGGRFSNNSFALTIAVTADCNFRCTYCYEQGVLRDTYMTADVIQGIKEIVDSRIPHVRRFTVTWYGGEPLMAMDTIKELSAYFIEKADENNVSYSAGVITNGYLLTREVVETLNDLKVNFYQVTIDGNREFHNKRRFLANGEGTFDVIWDNLVKSIDILPHVSLRINVDQSNIHAASEIAEMIHEKNMQDKVRPHLGRVLNDSDDPELEEVCFTPHQFAETDMDYSMRYSKNEYISKYPSLRANFCGADSICVNVIDADGKIYKCWNEVGHPDIAIGSVLDANYMGAIDHANEYLLFDPTLDPKCSKCKVLPNCMGGCPYYRTSGKSQYQCNYQKSNLESYISFVADNIMAERAKQHQEATV